MLASHEPLSAHPNCLIRLLLLLPGHSWSSEWRSRDESRSQKSHGLVAILDRKTHLFRLTRNFTDMFHDSITLSPSKNSQNLSARLFVMRGPASSARLVFGSTPLLGVPQLSPPIRGGGHAFCLVNVTGRPSRPVKPLPFFAPFPPRFWRELPPNSLHGTVLAGVPRGKPCRFSIHLMEIVSHGARWSWVPFDGDGVVASLVGVVWRERGV